MAAKDAPALTHDRLKELLHYDPITGIFTWTDRCPTPRHRWRAAGNPNKVGYIIIVVDRVRYRAHRLAWFWMTGFWPRPNPDHKDCDPANNRWDNLRLATPGQNRANSRKRKANGLPKGVFSHYGKFQAKIDNVPLGTFDTPEAASAAYVRAATERYGEFARSG